jgi:hypothetical protein
MSRINLFLAGLLLLAALPAALNAQDASPEAKAMIKDALSATTAEMAKGATVVDWENNVLKEGDNGWTCFPTPPQFETAPMCFDEPWLAWADGWMNKKEVNITRVGLAYMLAGDSGASNSDPYATEETDDWIVGGPHLMVIVPDASMLEGIPTDPESGGPWVMWKDTPYVHVMVPVED